MTVFNRRLLKYHEYTKQNKGLPSSMGSSKSPNAASGRHQTTQATMPLHALRWKNIWASRHHLPLGSGQGLARVQRQCCEGMPEKHTLTIDSICPNQCTKSRQWWSSPDGPMQMAASQGWSEGSNTELVQHRQWMHDDGVCQHHGTRTPEPTL